MAKNLMRQRLASAVTVSDIASQCRISVSYFGHAFANSVGISPYAWLLEQRVAQAKDLLKTPSIPISRIALDCGFTDQAHFTNTFSRKVGMTPRLWRIKHSPTGEIPR
ncbi:helix-turn-helix domain-containing protein [Sphingobium sp. R-21]|uniref:helix-turn-helix domain-containing protein n=1 Tax=Sphingobium sp. R-21 TaxID=3404056 RepID=UPI003CEDCCA9